MAGKQNTDDSSVRPRVDASSIRLASLRTSTDASSSTTAPTRRPKFVPKAVKRRTAVETCENGVSSEPQRTQDTKLPLTGAGALKRDNRGRVAFVGTLSGGSSYNGGTTSTPAPRSADYSAAGGTGISVLDDEEMPGGKMPKMEVEEVWPPVIKSIMEPMSLPIARPPEPESAGAVFCDATGDIVASDDSLFFVQLPTTLPLPNAVTKFTHTEDGVMESADDLKDQEAQRSKESKTTDESPDDGVFDHSIEAAPSGFIGKICVHKSGKMVLLLGGKQFEVAAAPTPSFCEEVYAVNTTEKQLSILGNIERHLVVTPDFDVLLH
ncbi:unnamed protein product [Peronospora belbahrii]|uniref:DNA-directed RNA polymerase III subunit RPC4 n=1 Tax=Peronospora belbahrii TaxID=622444 RepID=A0AAU9LCQ9_9STRA|nr:unnamed protein product [Peronospora belbahrii]